MECDGLYGYLIQVDDDISLEALPVDGYALRHTVTAECDDGEEGEERVRGAFLRESRRQRDGGTRVEGLGGREGEQGEERLLLLCFGGRGRRKREREGGVVGVCGGTEVGGEEEEVFALGEELIVIILPDTRRLLSPVECDRPPSMGLPLPLHLPHPSPIPAPRHAPPLLPLLRLRHHLIRHRRLFCLAALC